MKDTNGSSLSIEGRYFRIFGIIGREEIGLGWHG
jgi:hypothetical protein